MNNRGHFKKGYDPRRFNLTTAHRQKGYWNAVETIRAQLGHAGTYTAQRVLYKRMCNTESPGTFPVQPRPEPQNDGRQQFSRKRVKE